MTDNDAWVVVSTKKKNISLTKDVIDDSRQSNARSFERSKFQKDSFNRKDPFVKKDSFSKRESFDKKDSHDSNKNSFKKTGLSITIQIKNIMKKNISLGVFIETFIQNYSNWMKPQFIENNKALILKEASRNCRVDILEYLIHEHPHFKRGAMDRTFQPLNYCIWDQTSESIDNIINTLEILLKFGYDIFNLYDTESILGSIIHVDNKTPHEISSKIYNHIVLDMNFSCFKLFLTDTFNKINEDNSKLYQNKILFLLTRFPEEFGFNLLKRITQYQSITKLELYKSIDLISQIITSQPNLDDSELNRYFSLIDLERLQSDFIENLLLINLTDICKNYDFMIIRFYCAFLGSIYKFTNIKQKIINKISDFIDDKDCEFLKTFMIFLIHANINIYDMSPSESDLLNKYIEIFYIDKNISDKLTIETNFSNLLNKSMNSKQFSELFPVINYKILPEIIIDIEKDNNENEDENTEIFDEYEEESFDNLSKIINILSMISESNIKEIYDKILDLSLENNELLLLLIQSMYDLTEIRANVYKKLLLLLENDIENLFEKLNIVIQDNQEIINEYRLDNLHIDKYINMIIR